MNAGERDLGEVFKWVKISRTIQVSYAPELVSHGMSDDHSPEDLLVGVRVTDRDLTIKRLLLKLVSYRLMNDKLYPKTRVIDTVGAGLAVREVSPLAVVIPQGSTWGVDSVINPDIRKGILFVRHPSVDSFQYQIAREMLISKTDKLLQVIGKPPLPDYRVSTNWIRRS